jgi:ATP-dependent DNA helicase RecQ
LTLTKPVSAPEPQTHRIGEITCDEPLFERLVQLRKRLADERGVPPYIVFSDVTLRQIARDYPDDKLALGRVSGMGDKKLREFAAVLLSEIAEHLRTNPRQIFADDSFGNPAARPGRTRLSGTACDTLHRFRDGQTVEQIAANRQLAVSTVYGHLADALQLGEEVDLGKFLRPDQQQEIAAVFEKKGLASLAPVFEALGGRYDYGKLKLMRAALTRA